MGGTAAQVGAGRAQVGRPLGGWASGGGGAGAGRAQVELPCGGAEAGFQVGGRVKPGQAQVGRPGGGGGRAAYDEVLPPLRLW